MMSIIHLISSGLVIVGFAIMWKDGSLSMVKKAVW